MKSGLTPKPARKLTSTTGSKYEMPVAPNLLAQNLTLQFRIKGGQVVFSIPQQVKAEDIQRSLLICTHVSGDQLVYGSRVTASLVSDAP